MILLMLLVCSYVCTTFAADTQLYNKGMTKSQIRKTAWALEHAFLQNFDTNPEKVKQMFDAYHAEDVPETALIIQRLLKPYKSLIAAKHIALKEVIQNDKWERPTELLFNNQETLLALGGAVLQKTAPDMKGYVKVWDLEKKIPLFLHKCKGQVTGLCFSPNSEQLVVGDREEGICVFGLDGQIKYRCEKHKGSMSYDMSYSPDGMRLVSAAYNYIRVWNTANGNRIAKVNFSKKPVFVEPHLKVAVVEKITELPPQEWHHFPRWNSSAFIWVPSVDGKTCYYYDHYLCENNNNPTRGYDMSYSRRKQAYSIRDIHNEKLLHEIPFINFHQGYWEHNFSPSGNDLAIATADGSVLLYTCPTYQQSVASIKSLAQAFYVLKRLQEKDPGMLSVLYSAISSYFYPISDDAKVCFQELNASLSDTFKDIVNA